MRPLLSTCTWVLLREIGKNRHQHDRLEPESDSPHNSKIVPVETVVVNNHLQRDSASCEQTEGSFASDIYLDNKASVSPFHPTFDPSSHHRHGNNSKRLLLTARRNLRLNSCSLVRAEWEQCSTMAPAQRLGKEKS